MLKNCRELVAWQRAYELCPLVYRLTGKFPSAERFGLTAQMRRSAVSVPSNIAEGYGRRTMGEYLQLLHVADGSLCELDTQLRLAVDLEIAGSVVAEPAATAIGDGERLLEALIASLKQKAFVT